MDLDELRVFVAVAETGSMTRAARSLGFARATLRRRVNELESRIGAPLMERTTKGVRLTPAGQLLAERGRVLLEETSTLLAQARSLAGDPAGMLHVLMPVGMPPPVVAAGLELFRAANPSVSFELRYAADPLATVLEGVDVVIYFAADGERGGPGPAWIAEAAAAAPQRLFASESYLERRGMPRAASDLASHDLLLWQPPGIATRHLTLGGQTIELEAFVVSPQVEHLFSMAGRGMGIACAPDGGLDLSPFGRLVPVLPEVAGPTYRLCFAVPKALADLPKVRAFLQFGRRALQLAVGSG